MNIFGYSNWRLLLKVLATLHQMEKRIMAVLDDYITNQQAFNAEIASDLSDLKTQAAANAAAIATLTAELASAGLTQAQTDALAALTTAGQALVSTADTAAGKTPPASPAP